MLAFRRVPPQATQLLTTKAITCHHHRSLTTICPAAPELTIAFPILALPTFLSMPSFPPPRYPRSIGFHPTSTKSRPDPRTSNFRQYFSNISDNIDTSSVHGPSPGGHAADVKKRKRDPKLVVELPPSLHRMESSPKSCSSISSMSQLGQIVRGNGKRRIEEKGDSHGETNRILDVIEDRMAEQVRGKIRCQCKLLPRQTMGKPTTFLGDSQQSNSRSISLTEKCVYCRNSEESGLGTSTETASSCGDC